MKLGIFLTNQQHLDADMVSKLDDQIVMLHAARDRGWDSVMFGQHYLNEGNNQALQIVPLLARMAAESGDMQLGLGILLLNLHNPVYTAETIATLDIMPKVDPVALTVDHPDEATTGIILVPDPEAAQRIMHILEHVVLIVGEGRHVAQAVRHPDQVTVEVVFIEHRRTGWVRDLHDAALAVAQDGEPATV